MAAVVGAGDPLGTVLKRGSCVRIFTGAPLPVGADAVVPQEDCQFSSRGGRLSSVPLAGQHIRCRGMEMKKDDIVFKAGTKLSSIDMGVLAMLGMAWVPVFRKLKIAIITSGNELVPVEKNKALGPGKIYNSNEYLLRGLLADANAEIVFYKLVDDSYHSLQQALEQTDPADCIITTGGASVGEEDYLQRVLKDIGKVHQWKVAIKPGKPFLFGSLLISQRSLPLFGLPGNPGSALTVMAALVIPALRAMQGRKSDILPRTHSASSGFSVAADKRERYLRPAFREIPAKNSPYLQANKVPVLFLPLHIPTGLPLFPRIQPFRKAT